MNVNDNAKHHYTYSSSQKPPVALCEHLMLFILSFSETWRNAATFCMFDYNVV